jgi:hypothetical protein
MLDSTVQNIVSGDMPLWQKVHQLSELGESAESQMYLLSVTRVQLHNAAASGRRYHGVITNIPGIKNVRRRVKCAMGLVEVSGGIPALVAGLPQEVAGWLVDQVPRGGTLMELLRALITDAYTEEKSRD